MGDIIGRPHDGASDRDRHAFGEALGEPLAPGGAGARSQCEFVMRAEPAIHPGGGIAETLAGVTPPTGSAQQDIAPVERRFAPFRAPAEFSLRASGAFARQHLLPGTAPGIGKPHPAEVKQFVDQDALEFSAAGKDGRSKINSPPRDRTGGDVRS